MKILIDTHIVLALLRKDFTKSFPTIAKLLSEPTTLGFVSVASLWEIDIKTRIGKLDPGMQLDDIVVYLDAIGLSLLKIEASHVIASADPLPATRDPFDRLLLAQCDGEDMKLATIDQALVDHPRALR